MSNDVDVPEELMPDDRVQLGLGCEMCGKIDEHVLETGWMCFECSEVF